MEKQKGEHLDYGRGANSPKTPDHRDTKTAKPPLKGYDKKGRPIHAHPDKPPLSKP